MPVDPDLRLLRSFVVLVAEGGFTRAAVTMGVSQPALSQSIRRLEELLGARLVDRANRGPAAGRVAGAGAGSGSGVTLTPAGTAFHAESVAILARAERAVAEVRRIDARRRVVVGFGTSTPRSLVGVAVREGEADAGLEVALEHVPWGTEQDRLADGGVDVLVAQLPPGAVPPTWAVTVLGERPRVAVVPRDHPLAGRASVSIADLRSDPVIDAASDRAFWIVSPRPDGREPAVVGPPARTVEEMLALVAAGRGIAFTSTTVAENSGEAGVAFLLVEDIGPVSVAIVRRADDDRSEVHALVATMQAAWVDAPVS